MLRNIYQVWQHRRTGLFYAVKLEGTRVVGMTEGMVALPRALGVPALTYHPVKDPPKLSNPQWRVVRLTIS